MKDTNDEAPSSILDSEILKKRSPEELFAEIMKSLEEYTIEKAETVLCNKSKIFTILKTNRPIKIGNYHYGLSVNLREKGRLIIFEWNDRGMVREYSQRSDYKNLWECRDCHRKYKHQLQSTRCHIYLVNGIVFVSTDHDCKPRDYEIVMQYQKLLEEGNLKLARRMTQMVNFTYGENSLANIVNVIQIPPALSLTPSVSAIKGKTDDNKIVIETSTGLKQKSNDKSRILSTEKSPMNKRKRNDYEVEESGHSYNQICTTAVKKQKKEAANDPVKTYSFEMPSTSELKKICDKLDVKYSKEAKGFWNEIKFQKIDFSSKNIKTQKYKEKNFYKILSNFLTGKFSNYEQIYYSINCAFRDKLIADGEMPFEEIDLVCSSYTVTEKHLKFIAKYFPCRILIFNLDKDEVKKFGKWKKNDILTFVLSFSNRKYSVIVNL